MEVRCERCRAQYVFADDQVGEHGLTVRCSNCGHLFKVKRKAVAVAVTAEEAAAGAGAVTTADAQRAAAVRAAAQAVLGEGERKPWSLRQPSGKLYAFRDMTTLHRWIVERKAHREDEISRAGEAWRRLGGIPELQSFFAVVEAAERALTPQPPRAPAASPGAVASHPPPGPAPAPPAEVPPPPPGPAREAHAPRGVIVPPPPAPDAPALPADEIPVLRPTPLPAPPPAEDPLFAPAHPHREDSFQSGLTGALPLSAETLRPTAPSLPSPAAAWEGGVGAAAEGAGREPAWAGAGMAEAPAPAASGAPAAEAAKDLPRRTPIPDPVPPRRRSVGPVFAAVALAGLAGGAAAWWLFLRAPDPIAPAAPAAAEAPAPKPEAQAQAQSAKPEVAPAASAPGPAPSPAPVTAAAEPAAAPAAAAPAAPAAEAPKPPAPAPEAVKPAPPEAAKGEAPKAEPPKPEAKAAATAAAAEAKAPAAPAARAPAAKAEPTAKELVARATRLLGAGKAHEALALYGKAVELEPKNARALAGRGWCQLDLSQYAQATAAFQAALEASPRAADPLLGLAETARFQGRREEAIGYYQAYLAVQSTGDGAEVARNAIRTLKE